MLSNWQKVTLAALLAWFVAFGGIVLAYPKILDPWWSGVLVFATGLIFFGLYGVATTSMKQNLERHDLCLCLTCRYPLDAQPGDEGKCPECGEYFSKGATKTIWKERYWPKIPPGSCGGG